MAENVRPPVAIRIVRPYDTEDQLLEHELETIGKTSVVLIGAHPRPTGVILRFEVTLASGATVLRGEGRVLAHKENAFRGQPGLTLRFTRLDPRSKGVVDRATSMRELRSQSERGTPSRPPPPPEAVAEALTAATPEPARTASNEDVHAEAEANVSGEASAREEHEAEVESARAAAREKANAIARTNAKRTGRNMGLTPPPIPVIEDQPTPAPTPVTSIPGEVQERSTAAPPATAPTISAPPLRGVGSRGAASSRRMPVATPTTPPPETKHIEAPADRAALLARLRERAEKLPPERVQEILTARR